jgi:hypothetical protein
VSNPADQDRAKALDEAARPFRRIAAILIVAASLLLGGAGGAALALMGGTPKAGIVGAIEICLMVAVAGDGIALGVATRLAKRLPVRWREAGARLRLWTVAVRYAVLLSVLALGLTDHGVRAMTWGLIGFLAATLLSSVVLIVATGRFSRRRGRS